METRAIYQKFLKDELDRRKRRNGSYSLRAYARDIGVPSSKLSQYINGECGLSAEKAEYIAGKLRLSPAEVELFSCSAEASHARDAVSRDLAKERLQELLSRVFNNVNMEKFSLIRDWYHFAILELTEVSGFQSSVQWIAQVLGIPENQVQEAVERLDLLGLLDVSGERWVQTQKDFETPPDFKSRAIREYHRQMLNVVESRFEDIPLELRELGSVVFALDKDLVPEFKDLLRRFQKEAAALAERSSQKDSVYVLNYQLLPVYSGEK